MIDNLLLLDPKQIPNIILLGKDGLGQKKDAIRLASYILDTDSDLIESSSDYLFVDGTKETIKKEMADQLSFFASHAPVMAYRRVVLVEDANSLTTQAQNALLRVLESRNELTCFIFIAKQYLLKTIHSRSITIEYVPLTDEQLREKLVNMGEMVDEEVLIASDGSLSLYQELMASPTFSDDLKRFKEALIKGTAREIFAATGCLKESDMKPGKGSCLFIRYTSSEMRAFYTYLSRQLRISYLSRLAKGMDNGLFDYFSDSYLKEIMSTAHEQLKNYESNGPVTKADFFCLMCLLCKEGTENATI